jgi:hypothetical protein
VRDGVVRGVVELRSRLRWFSSIRRICAGKTRVMARECGAIARVVSWDEMSRRAVMR